MSDEIEVTAELIVNIDDWVKKAAANPETLAERQVTEIFLSAISLTLPLRTKVFLKGGVLMGVVYDSPRQTGDVDLTTTMEPSEGVADQISKDLNEAFPRSAAKLGYPDLMCRVQSSKYLPRKETFPDATGPALKVKIGYARRGSAQEALYQQGKSPHVLEVDISFREPMHAVQIIRMGDSDIAIRAYSLNDLIAEKLRALLQQVDRNRYRRQDIYDLAILIQKFALLDDEKAILLDTLIMKCQARKVEPNIDSLRDDEVKRRAGLEWKTLAAEIDEVPDFNECFALVEDFYRSLPWQ